MSEADGVKVLANQAIAVARNVRQFIDQAEHATSLLKSGLTVLEFSKTNSNLQQAFMNLETIKRNLEDSNEILTSVFKDVAALRDSA